MIAAKLIKIIVPVLVIFAAIFIYISIPKGRCQAFAEQSESFIRGRLDIPSRVDSVYYNGKYYWPQGPFPSVILVPFQLVFGPSFNQTLMQPILTLTLSYILYKLALIKRFAPLDSLKLVFVFFFGSEVFGIITEPCYSFFAHVVSMTLLAYLLLEFENKQRWAILGLVSGSLIATRPTAGLIIPAIIYYILRLNKNSTRKYYHLILFILPIFFAVLLLLEFNRARFQNPFETGYSSNDVGQYLNSLRKKGVFNIQHLPNNFYYYFLSPPQSVNDRSANLIFPYLTYNSLGLSFFIVSPFFIYALKTFQRLITLIKLYWVTIFVTLFILLTYYTPGWVQFGPRFVSDFMPILYLLLLYGLKPPVITSKQTTLILLSSVVNTYLLLTGFFLFKR